LPHSKKCFSEKEEDMGVRRGSKHEVIDVLRRGYRGAGRVEKGRLIDEAIAVPGYDRRYAQRLLRGGTPYKGPRLGRAGRARRYGPEVTRALEVAAEATGWIGGKRLAPFLPELISALEKEGALRLNDAGRATVQSATCRNVEHPDIAASSHLCEIVPTFLRIWMPKDIFPPASSVMALPRIT